MQRRQPSRTRSPVFIRFTGDGFNSCSDAQFTIQLHCRRRDSSPVLEKDGRRVEHYESVYTFAYLRAGESVNSLHLESMQWARADLNEIKKNGYIEIELEEGGGG